jgi:carbonic anhydrase
MQDPLLDQSAPARRAFFQKNHDLLAQLAQEGQRPQALFIACADSRITPTQLLGTNPGDLFMLRNIANIIPPYIQTEIGIVSTLEFALYQLKVPHIIICGHTDCGGILSLDQHIDMSQQPALSRWLDLARPAQRDVDFQMRDLSPAARHQAIVERNIILQLNNLQSYPFIRQAITANHLTLHGWVYDLQQQHIRFYNPATDTFIVA